MTSIANWSISIHKDADRVRRYDPIYNRLAMVSWERLWSGQATRQSLSLLANEGVSTNADDLLEEYQALVDVELAKNLTAEDAVRLHDIETQLNEQDANDPAEQAIDARMQETSDQLSAILQNLQKQRYRSHS
jgi:hypothetical protein